MTVDNGVVKLDANARPTCVHVIPQTHDAGAENQAQYLLEGLSKLDILNLEVVYFAPGCAHASFEALGLPMQRVERQRRLLFDLIPRGRRLRTLFANGPPDIMHTWLLEGNLVGLVAARGLVGTRLVISQRGGANEWQRPWLVRTQRALSGRADHGISNSSVGADMLRRCGMDDSEVSIIPNAIPPRRTEPTEERAETRRCLGLQGQTPVVLTVARTDRYAVAQKGLDILLDAMAQVRERVPGVILLLLGSTTQELRDTGIELPHYVRALGYRPEPANVMNAADVLAIASRAEGHSNAAAEALLMGLPVATTASGDHAGLVAEAGGRVVAVEDHAALAAAVVGLLEDPPHPAAVRDSAQPKLAIERLVSSTVGVYQTLLEA